MTDLAPQVDALSETLQEKWDECRTDRYEEILLSCNDLVGQRFTIETLNDTLNERFEVKGQMFSGGEQDHEDFSLYFRIDPERAFDIYYLKMRRPDKFGNDIYITGFGNHLY